MIRTATSPAINPKLVPAMQALQANRPDDAVAMLDRFCQKNKRDVQAWFMLSSAYGMKGAIEDVIRCARQVLKLSPNHTGAFTHLGNAYASQGQHEESARYYQKALRQAPNDATLLFNTGMALKFAGEFEKAAEYFKKAITVNPGHPHARAGLGEAVMSQGKVEEAIEHFTIALQTSPNLFLAHRGLGGAYLSAGKLEEGLKHFEKATQLNDQDPGVVAGYVTLVGLLRDRDESLELLEKSMAKMPESPVLLAAKAELLEHCGQPEEAFRLALSLESRGMTSPISAATLLRVSHRFNYSDQALAITERILRRDNLLGSDIQTLCFAAGKLLDKLGRYDEAFGYYQKANNSVQIPYDHEDNRACFDHLISTFTRETIAGFPRATNEDHRPVLIVGMPRSGTTLTEQILASHSSVHGAGELRDIKLLAAGDGSAADPGYLNMLQRLTPAYLDHLANKYLDKLDTLAPGALRVTDKRPHNFLHLALIHLLFPKATLIHCRRNPIDTCLSIYFQNFSWTHSYASDLESLGRYYLEYERLMEHWAQALDKPILTVQYEETVADQEGMTRKLLAHCGLEWDDACLEFHEVKRDIKTASYDQVRQQMYNTSVERWRNYEKHIVPLLRILAKSSQLRVRL